MPRPPVYLDCHATTPVDRRVLDAMLPYFSETFGNPASSTHEWGWKAQEAVDQARKQVAAAVGATAREIVFTSGATESNNLAIRGIADRTPADRRHLIVSAVEHKSVLEVAHLLESQGWRVTCVPVERTGRVRMDVIEDALRSGAAIVSVMAANNEIGTIQPLAEIGALAHAHGALFHVDAAQAVGKIPIDVNAMQIDLLSLTAHKIYGPKGCGAIFIRRRVELSPLLIGGGHERGVRAGTLNVPGIVGLGTACALACASMDEEGPRVRALRDRLLDGLCSQLTGVSVNGGLENRLPNNLHVGFDGVDGESLLVGIGNIAVSTGSACSSATGQPSYVLQALLGADVPSAYVRFGLGRFTTADEIDYAIQSFVTVVKHLRDMAPV
ncbi:MAG: cysteine desulfurase family protein [Acidobacteriota bacterium]